jgi:23S rRNA-/tRNA-specific pseudouridylate synthase
VRIDKWLQKQGLGLTGRQIEEALDSGLVTSGEGKRLKKGHVVDELCLPRLDKLHAHLRQLKAGNSRLSIGVVGKGEGFWAVDKPAGVPSLPISLFDEMTLTQWALAQDPAVSLEFPGAQPTVVPHRLDISTSGVQIVCRTAESFREWRESFESKSVQKSYLAWCWGKPEKDRFRIELPLVHDPRDSSKMRVGEEGRGRVREAISEIIVKVQRTGFFLAEVRCLTGVTHQVRVHLASQGFPLLGDELYDENWSERGIKPKHHQLRASRLVAPLGDFSVDCAEFIQAPSES